MRPESIHSGHRLGWPGLVVLALVPLLAVGTLLGLVRGSNNQGIRAAVVNHDKAVTVDGRIVPLGRQLASEMVAREGTNISWTIADAEDAEAGLNDGRYSAVVTIPEGFSEAATSFSSNDAAIAKQATISVVVSKNAPFADAALAHDIAGLATDTINATLTKAYLENIYIGFNRVGEQFKQIVDGAGKLNEAGSQLADGATTAANNSEKLAGGLGELSAQGKQLGSAANTLAEGSQKLSGAAGTLAGGAGNLANGTRSFAGGIAQLNAQAPRLADGVNQLTDGATPLLEGVSGYTSGTVGVLDGVSELRNGLAQLEAGLNSQLDPEAMKEAQAALGQLVPALREAQQALKQYFPGASNITIEEVRSKLAAFDAQLNKLDSTLAGYASGETPPPSELKEFAQRLVANWKCPIEEAETCKLLREAYQQGVGDALNKGFQQGAKAALGVLQQTDPKTGKTLLETARGFSRMGLGMTESVIKLRDALAKVVPAGTDPLTALEQLPSKITEQAQKLTGGVAKLREGADTILTKAEPLRTNAEQLGTGATQLLGGLRQLRNQTSALPAATARLAEGANQLASGSSQLADGAGQLSSGVGQLSSGAGQLADGTGKYVTGVGQAADGATQLAAGLLRLGAGSRELSQGLGAFHDKLSEAGSKLPNYSDSDRDTLSQVVASPVLKDGKVYEAMMVPLAALLAVAALWLGSLLSWSFARPVPSDLIASSRTSATLWLRTLWPPAALGAVQGLLFGVAVGMALELTPGRTIGAAALLTMVGVSFAVVNHALTGWFGNVGRGISVLALVVTVALGLTSTTPGWVQGVAGISPLHNGLLLVRTFLASGSGLVALGGAALLFGVIAVGLSYLAIASRRHLTADQFRSRVVGVAGV